MERASEDEGPPPDSRVGLAQLMVVIAIIIAAAISAHLRMKAEEAREAPVMRFSPVEPPAPQTPRPKPKRPVYRDI